MPKIYLCLFLLALFSLNLKAQNSAALLRELLDLPSPPAVQKNADEEQKTPRPAEFYDDKNVPADDAAIEDLFDYWKNKATAIYIGNSEPPQPSVKSALRMLEALEKEPEDLTDFLKILPAEKEVAEKVKFIFETALQAENVGSDSRDGVKKWLKFNTAFYVGELLSEAEKAKDKEGYVENSGILKALVKVDWKAAKDVLQKLENDKNNPRAATFAKTLLYSGALKAKDESEIEKRRRELQAIVTDKKASPFARDAAADALFATAWQGQDNWY